MHREDPECHPAKEAGAFFAEIKADTSRVHVAADTPCVLLEMKRGDGKYLAMAVFAEGYGPVYLTYEADPLLVDNATCTFSLPPKSTSLRHGLRQPIFLE